MNNYIYNNLFITTLLKIKIKISSINNNNNYYFDFYNISILQSMFEKNNFMFVIQPQNYHFFLENERLIYHPNNKHLDGLLKQYSCPRDFELAYNLLPIIDDKKSGNKFPKVICHKNLKYLKSYVYKLENIIHYRVFFELMNPINAIGIVLNDIIGES